MKILVLNTGSSSIKYELFENTEPLMQGLIGRIGEKGSRVKSHNQGIRLMIKQLLKSGKIASIKDIKAVGHRVVHGGEHSKPCLITGKVIGTIKKYSSLAPLHNPVNLKGIMIMKKILPKAKHAAVFDTAFHQTMPEHAKTYAIPYQFSKRNIRRYGFHGTSHKYVSLEASKLLKKPFGKLKLITCHLGNGCSMAAIKNGKVIDTSMGFTPLEGLVMGTRSGDIDPGIVLHLAKKIGAKNADKLLNSKSGLAGLSGVSKDMRAVLEAYKKGSMRARLAIEVFTYRIKKYIGAYAAAMDGVDAVVFTAGIGENSPLIRSWSTKCLGIALDAKKNQKNNKIISSSKSKIKVLVIPTDEEKMIASETLSVIRR